MPNLQCYYKKKDIRLFLKQDGKYQSHVEEQVDQRVNSQQKSVLEGVETSCVVEALLVVEPLGETGRRAAAR